MELARTPASRSAAASPSTTPMQTCDPDDLCGRRMRRARRPRLRAGRSRDRAGRGRRRAYRRRGGELRGSVPTTKLKVVGTDVFSMGDVEQLDQRSDITHASAWRNAAETYRRLVHSPRPPRRRARRRRLAGGQPHRSRPSAIAPLIWPWQALRFARTGRLNRRSASRSLRAHGRARRRCATAPA